MKGKITEDIKQKISVINKYGDDIGSMADFTQRELYLMTKYKGCTIKP
jgi:hypothetical protein